MFLVRGLHTCADVQALQSKSSSIWLIKSIAFNSSHTVDHDNKSSMHFSKCSDVWICSCRGVYGCSSTPSPRIAPLLWAQFCCSQAQLPRRRAINISRCFRWTAKCQPHKPQTRRRWVSRLVCLVVGGSLIIQTWTSLYQQPSRAPLTSSMLAMLAYGSAIANN